MMSGCQTAEETQLPIIGDTVSSAVPVVASQVDLPSAAATEAINLVNTQDTISAWEQSNGSLTVRLFILPEMTVLDPYLTLNGEAPPGSVVSVNDEVILVTESGQFSVNMALTEGPNWIDVVVSNQLGESVSFGSAVYYEPGT